MTDPAGRGAPIGEEPLQGGGHLVLVGMTGAGKSSVGRLVADRLNQDWVDTDQLIEKTTGRSVREIFATDGEPAFRTVESDVLREALAQTSPTVISTGGGIVLSQTNRDLLSNAQHRVVWLMADPSILLERLQHGMHRPLLDNDPEGTLARMWEQREALYREVADVIVSVDGRSIAEVAEAILR
jgi:shikimate kinase